MKKSALFQENSERTRVFLQSSLADQLDTRHSSKLDAEFNARKILDQVATGRGNPLLYAGNADKLMLLIVCPDSPEVRAEQLNMISELYRILRADNDFQKISRKASSAAITETYRHVWLDDDGKVTGLTRPIFQGGHFSFING